MACAAPDKIDFKAIRSLGLNEMTDLGRVMKRGGPCVLAHRHPFKPKDNVSLARLLCNPCVTLALLCVSLSPVPLVFQPRVSRRGHPCICYLFVHLPCRFLSAS